MNNPKHHVQLSASIIEMLSPILSLYKHNIDKIVQPFGISAGQTPLLMLLYKKDGRSQKDLASQLNVKASSLTSMLARMEKAELIYRVKNKKDLRVTTVYLTEKGRKASKKTHSVIKFINERNLAGLKQNEKELFLKLLRQMYENLEKQQVELSFITKDETGRKSKTF